MKMDEEKIMHSLICSFVELILSLYFETIMVSVTYKCVQTLNPNYTENLPWS